MKWHSGESLNLHNLMMLYCDSVTVGKSRSEEMSIRGQQISQVKCESGIHGKTQILILTDTVETK